MNRAEVAEERVLQSWREYQEALRRAIAPLTREQLAARPLTGRRTPGEVAEHIVFGRAFHTHRVLGSAAENLLPYFAWNVAGVPARDAADIVVGLDVTWEVIAGHLMSGTPTSEIAPGEATLQSQTIWGLFDHDLPHAGQLSLLLRASGLAGVQI
jgi:hypothetical protein